MTTTARPSATDVIAALRSATSSEKSQILEALGTDAGAGGTAARVAADIEAIRGVLAVLTEPEAVLLLSDTAQTVWGVNERELVNKMEPFLDAHWEALEGDLGRIQLVCGVVGKRVLRNAEKRVVGARRQRGAQSIAALLMLEEMARERAAAEGIEEEEMLQVVAATYQELVAEYGQQLGLDPGADAIHGWAVGDLLLLGRCKRWLKESDPRTYWGDWKVLNQRLYGIFMSCKRSGMEPGINEAEVRRERAKHPHVLYAGLRKGEAAKWGGYLENVGGRPDQGQRVWGGGKDAEEMGKSIARWMDEKAKAKGIENGERGGFRLIP